MNLTSYTQGNPTNSPNIEQLPAWIVAMTAEQPELTWDQVVQESVLRNEGRYPQTELPETPAMAMPIVVELYGTLSGLIDDQISDLIVYVESNLPFMFDELTGSWESRDLPVELFCASEEYHE